MPVIKCPHCLESIDLVQYARNQAQAKLLRALDGFGPSWSLVWEYLLLFRGGPGRPPWAAMTAAAEQLQEIWRGGWFNHRQQSYRVERLALEQALTRLVNYPPAQRPKLRNNNYLITMLLPAAKDQRRQAAQAEAKQEQAKRSAPTREPRSGAPRQETGGGADLGDILGGVMQRAAAPRLSQEQAAELADSMFDYAELTRQVMVERRKVDMDRLTRLESAIRGAGVDMPQLIKLAKAGTVSMLTGPELLRELGLAVEGAEK